MAKPPGRGRRPVADWVFRNDLYDGAGAPIDVNGSYVPDQSKTIAPGFGAAPVFWLYDSYNFTSDIEALGLAGLAAKGRWRRPEASKPLIKRVRGEITFTPSVWALGSSYFMGVRFGIFTQDANNGLVILDPNYNMWGVASPTTVQMQHPSRFANDKSWQHQRMHIERFNDNNSSLNWRFNFAVNRKLRPDQGYGVYVETAVGSVNVQINLRLMTLVSDEG